MQPAQLGIGSGPGHRNAFVADLGCGGEHRGVDGERATERPEVGREMGDGGGRGEHRKLRGIERQSLADGVQQILSPQRLIRDDEVSTHGEVQRRTSGEGLATETYPGHASTLGAPPDVNIARRPVNRAR